MFYIFSYKKSNNTVLQFRPVFVFVKHLKTAWHLTEFTAHICRTKRWDEISLQIQVLVVCKLSISTAEAFVCADDTFIASLAALCQKISKLVMLLSLWFACLCDYHF